MLLSGHGCQAEVARVIFRWARRQCAKRPAFRAGEPMTSWRQTRRRGLCVAIVAAVALLRASVALAVISQGDLTLYMFFETREAGRWGEGSSGNNAILSKFTTFGVIPGKSATETGGSFDFNHWDLVEARQLASIRPHYELVKNRKLLGRVDTIVLQHADFFAYYRPWYDAEGTLKNKGRAEAFRDWNNYTHQQLQEQYFRNDLHEYYADLDFTDNFSMRIGKQQIIWSEANILAGTEITNPADVTYHGFVGAEAAEDERKNLEMIKANYILPDFLKTGNNELEAFLIPGDFESGSDLRSNITIGGADVTTDSRNPYAVPVSLVGPFAPVPMETEGILFHGLTYYNQEGQPVRITSLLDEPAKPMILVGPNFFDYRELDVSHTPSKSLENSEFGTRYSTILPIGEGLQSSLIFLYEARDPKSVVCVECAAPEGFTPFERIPGLFVEEHKFFFGKPRPGVPKLGRILFLNATDYRRNPYFGATGTYYDSDFTRSVFRYDLFYAPRVGVSAPTAPNFPKSPAHGGTFGKWTELSRFVFGVDRPTLLPIVNPYLTKQFTFLTLQATETWYPDLPAGAIPNDPLGKIRKFSTFLTLSGTNFLLNGRSTNLTGASWDVDDQTGELMSNTVYRYSRDILIGTNIHWYLGRSGRHTDPFLESKSQRINELEFTFTYEL
jgi:hypothetical protein